MGEGDRPAETASRVIPLRTRSGPRRVPQLLSPGDVARRLAALERQVEDALGAERVGRGSLLLERAMDDVLDAYTSTRSWLAEQTAGLASSSILGELSLTALRRWWWRVDVVGRERIPFGPVVVVANRGSTLLPYDALMAAVALGASAREPRGMRPFVDEWLMDLPFVGPALDALGAERASPLHVRRALDAGEIAIVFPEGRDAVARPYTQAYRVGRFTRMGLLRVAIETGLPIVPIGLIGVDEVHPVLARVPLPRLLATLGIPALPVTPTVVPLPTKWRLFVGDPLDTAAHHRPDDARDPAAVRALANQVRERLQGLVSDGLRRRRSLFL
jgi:1-acyl-sn-glycerol-3-phosphate acyltransferase